FVAARAWVGEGGGDAGGSVRPVRILLWHGYLLGGTGSNVYTRMLAREWSRAGHDVVVLCQEPHPEGYDMGGAEVVRPDGGGRLPVSVLHPPSAYVGKVH